MVAKCNVFVYKLNKVQFFSLKQNFSSGRQAFAKSQHCFFRSEENVYLIKFQHLGCMGASVL